MALDAGLVFDAGLVLDTGFALEAGLAFDAGLVFTTVGLVFEVDFKADFFGPPVTY